MGHIINRLVTYLRYYYRAKTIYQIHSPFLYNLLTNIAAEDKLYYDFQILDDLRRRLYLDETRMASEDPGAGSQLQKQTLRVCDIARTALSPRWKAEFLYRLMLELQPRTILELGTSLGLTTMYLAKAAHPGEVYTIEGRPDIAEKAMENFNKIKIPNVKLIEGRFDYQLQPVLKKIQTLDFVVLDGNHRYKPTVSYFDEITSAHKPKVVLVDDIHWSKEMTMAWKKLKSTSQYNIAIDFYHFGLLIEHNNVNHKIDIAYIEYWKKFWRMGFWS